MDILNPIPHRNIGFEGEDIAVRFLEEKNYKILARNWMFHHLEVDIIAESGPFIVFCEVKRRKNNLYGEPECFVDTLKQKHMIAAANYFMQKYQLGKEARFDIISILSGPLNTEIKHFENAFIPQW